MTSPRRFRWPLLLVAWAVTFGVLPYLWGRTLVMGLLTGHVPGTLAAATAVVVLILMALTWDLRPPGRGVGVFLGWLVANGILFGLFAAPTMPLWQLLAVYVPATVWVVWLAWLGAWPLRWPARLGLLGVWAALGVLGPVLIRVDGLTGDTENARAKLSYSWRDFRRTEYGTAAGRAVVTPTPDDFPRYLGPAGTGVLPDAKIAGDWTAAPPRERWRRPVGAGWGGFVIVGGYAFTQEQREDTECVCCYRLDDGQPVWVHEDAARYDGIGGPGPRATPAFSAGRLYAVGATGILNCLDAADGRPVWSVNILDDNQVKNDVHGVCASPLVDGDRVLVCPAGGPSLAAYHAETGRRLWAAGTDRASYSSPMIANLGGVRQILLANRVGVTGHDAADGRVLWSAAWVNKEGINAGQPVVGAAGPDTVLLSTAYGKGVALFNVSHSAGGDWSADEAWSNLTLKAKFSTPVLYRGHVYGLDDGILTCIDPRTGKRRWKDGRYGHGQLLLAGDRLIVQTEAGPVVLVEPSPDGLRERGRVAALNGKTWNTVALVGRMLLVRNDHEAACLELPGR
jgi:outer membrane protein assembly factor BamB